MKNDDLNKIWLEIEAKKDYQKSFLLRMVYVNLLWRAYIGCSGVPSRRLLSLEIPEEKKNEFDTFVAPQGFTLSIDKPGVSHKGYVACVLQAASSDLNDVFTILATDILEELCKQKNAEQYITSLKNRIQKWREFFKNLKDNRLSDKMAIGLIGELSFIKDLHEAGICIISDMWNGPINASQDFQGNRVAIEVKTTVANSMEYVHISSEEQLNGDEKNYLFLVTYRAERNDATGVKLPELIGQVGDLLSDRQRLSFYAKLQCMGYSRDDAHFYNKGYAVREQRVFKVEDGFPRILRTDLPQGISEINYRLSLLSCDDYESKQEDIIEAIKECEYGES